MNLRSILRKLHRWISLACMALWALQAGTGVLIVFHWEIDDALVGGYHHATDWPLLETRIAALTPPGWHPSSLWTSAGAPDRWDLTLEGPGAAERSLRLAGDGTVLRDRSGGAMNAIDYLVGLHQELLAGDIGQWIIGISGGVLVVNLLMGLWLAWPRKPLRWRQALTPTRRGPKPTRIWSWHRAVGLVLVVPALLVAGSGTIRRFDDGLSTLFHVSSPSLPPIAGTPKIGLAQAVSVGREAIPGSRLSAVNWPDAADATWRIRLIAPDEWRRAYGMSVVLVDARSGAVRGSFPASAAPLLGQIINDAWAIHTGEVLGVFGRLVAELTGIGLLAMVWLGLRLWWLRRSR